MAAAGRASWCFAPLWGSWSRRRRAQRCRRAQCEGWARLVNCGRGCAGGAHAAHAAAGAQPRGQARLAHVHRAGRVRQHGRRARQQPRAQPERGWLRRGVRWRWRAVLFFAGAVRLVAGGPPHPNLQPWRLDAHCVVGERVRRLRRRRRGQRRRRALHLRRRRTVRRAGGGRLGFAGRPRPPQAKAECAARRAQRHLLFCSRGHPHTR